MDIYMYLQSIHLLEECQWISVCIAHIYMCKIKSVYIEPIMSTKHGLIRMETNAGDSLSWKYFLTCYSGPTCLKHR